MRTFVTQAQLAKHLGVTDRRVRQMVEERILPEPRDGRFHLARCVERYGLFKGDRPLEPFFDRVERDSADADRLLAEAMAEGATIEAVRAASRATQDIWSDMKFLTAIRSRSDAERSLFWGIWQEKEDRTLGGLIARAIEILGVQGIDFSLDESAA